MIQIVPEKRSEKGFTGAVDATGVYTTLDRLDASHEAAVAGLTGNPSLRRRLMEAGFVNGSRVRFLMSTPFGDPLVFSLRGTSIALRKSEARCVSIRY